MASMSWKNSLKKKLEKVDGASTESATPKWWIGAGNYCINHIMSGNWEWAVPQGRITAYSGPSGSGKSFIIANIIKQALADGVFVVAMDSENALDDNFLTKVGVDVTSENYLYVSVKNMSSATKTLQTITKDYNAAIKTKTLDTLPRLLIVIDSLDFLFVDGMLEEYETKGVMGSDQGLHSKKLKQFLNFVVSDIKYIPVAVLTTKQVYVDQTKYASPPWKMAESIKYALSQLMLVTRLITKDAKTKEILGITLKVFGWKTRFTEPFQQVEIFVPYSTGLDPYEGLLPVAVSLGVVEKEKGGSWYYFGEKKFQSGGFKKYQVEIFEAIKALGDVQINAVSEDSEEEMVSEKTARAKAKEKLAKLVKAGKVVPGEDDDIVPDGE